MRDGLVESDTAAVTPGLTDMRLGEAFRVAVDALRANRLRSLLTMLGVIIGVAAVVILVAIGSGAKQEVESQVEGLGSNIIFVVAGNVEFGAAPSISRLQLEDVDELGRVLGNPEAVATTVSSGEFVSVGSTELFSTINGTNENTPNVFNRPVARGEYLTAADVDTRRRVAVLGSNVANELFPDIEPLGRQVTIAGVRFRVIGVFEEVGSTFGVSRDDEVHIPVTAAQQLFGVDRIDALAIKAPTIDDVDSVRNEVLAALNEKYPDEEFSAVTQTQILGNARRHPWLADAGSCSHCRNLLARWWRRRFEHHVGLGPGENPRDRLAEGFGCEAT